MIAINLPWKKKSAYIDHALTRIVFIDHACMNYSQIICGTTLPHTHTHNPRLHQVPHTQIYIPRTSPVVLHTRIKVHWRLTLMR